METWDDEKLKKVVLSKYGNPKTTTDVRLASRSGKRWALHLQNLLARQIVCKHFIQAIEDEKYGWYVDGLPFPRPVTSATVLTFAHSH